MSRYLENTSADICCGQETRIREGRPLATAEDAARRRGWRARLSPAMDTPAGRASGGVAIACRFAYGATDVSESAVPDGARHRMTVSWINAYMRGGLYVVSVWLRDSEGLSPGNLDLLQLLARVLINLKGPWVVAADWNITPEVLVKAAWLRMVGGHIHANSAPTCNDKA